MRVKKTVGSTKAVIDGPADFVASAKPVVDAVLAKLDEEKKRYVPTMWSYELVGPPVPMKVIRMPCPAHCNDGYIELLPCWQCNGLGTINRTVRDLEIEQ